MFLPDQKIICINDRFPKGIEQIYTALPVKDSLYTCRDVVPGIEFSGKATVTVLLAELHNTPKPAAVYNLKSPA